jgi:hypothetical protein
MGNLGSMVDSIFIPRGGTDESRLAALNAIKHRQELIETTGMYNQLLIFPEGCTTNGAGLVKFKKGAFYAEKSITPVIMKYNVNGTYIPSFDCMPLLPLAIMQLSWSCMTCTVIELPEFQPTEQLFEKHKDKGTERWEIFAWAARDFMADASGLSTSDVPWKEKQQYEEHMKCNPKFKHYLPDHKRLDFDAKDSAAGTEAILLTP